MEAGAKALKVASQKGPVMGVDFQRLAYEKAKADQELLAFKKMVDEGKAYNGQAYQLRPVNRKMAEDVSNLVGFDVSGYNAAIRKNAIEHIDRRHGENGIHNRSMANPEDLGKIQYVLDHYGGVEIGDVSAKGLRNRDGTYAKTIVFSKRINGTYYVIQAVPNSKRNTMEIITIYKQNPKK